MLMKTRYVMKFGVTKKKKKKEKKKNKNVYCESHLTSIIMDFLGKQMLTCLHNSLHTFSWQILSKCVLMKWG